MSTHLEISTSSLVVPQSVISLRACVRECVCACSLLKQHQSFRITMSQVEEFML